MKTRRILALLLALCMLLGTVPAALAAETGDGIVYQEAVELMSYLGVLEPIGGADLGGKAGQPITWNEARAFTLAFSKFTPAWYNESNAPAALTEDREITGAEFLSSFVHKMLLSDMRDDYFGGGAPDVTAHVYRLLSGLGKDYAAFSGAALTREEACQVMMNALNRQVGTYPFQLKNSCGVWEEISTDNSLTDEWCRPVSRWCADGSNTPVTKWYTKAADYAGDGSITTHVLLQTLGLFDFGDGNYQNNPWCNFHMIVNGQKDMDWTAGKLHWNHASGDGCEKNRISDRTGSRMEVYYLGDGTENIPDAGGDVNCRIYRVVYIDEYLAYIENQSITIYPNEGGGTWSWSAPELPARSGWYTINVNSKGQYATAVNIALARVERSSQNGMELPADDGINYVYNSFGKFPVNSKCQVGYDIIASMEYYESKKVVSFLYDTKGNVIGVIDAEIDSPDDPTDVSSDSWFASVVAYVVKQRLMEGFGDGRFAPEENCTRAMIWAVLARTKGATVSGKGWTETARRWVVAHGVSDGSNPDAKITREQLVTMFYRMAGEPAGTYDLDSYQDSASISAYARPAMAWALQTGLLSSNTTRLRPTDSATRAEVAAILSRR